MHDGLETYLEALDSGDNYRVDAVLKETPHEITERVFLIAANGDETGPFLRKRFSVEAKTGSAYARIYEAQKNGQRFLYLPRIFECCENDGALVVVMEWVDGQTLEETIAQGLPNEELAYSVFPNICDAVDELHTRFTPPLIHRDITPSNIMLSSGGITLVDFGIARTYDETSVHDTTCFGTRAYAPPEQFGYGQTDERSDIYALGMVLFYCLTGSLPSPNALREDGHQLGVAPAVYEVIEKATAFDPRFRFDSVGQFKRAFSAAIQEQTLPGSPLSEPPATSTTQKASENATQALDERIARSKIHVPDWVGRTWNIVVLLAWMILIAAAIGATITPSGGAERYSFVARAIVYFGAFIPGSTLIAYMLLDKRRLRQKIKIISDLTWRQELPVCLVTAFVLLIVMVMIANAIG